jgi:hypothetical protein
MPDLLEKTGNIVFLRAHDLGTGYGPPSDQLDVEAVFILNALGDGGYGFQLRNDDNLPARQAMFSLLRDAFVHNLTVIADYLIEPGRINGTAIRVALIRGTGSGFLSGTRTTATKAKLSGVPPAPRAKKKTRSGKSARTRG